MIVARPITELNDELTQRIQELKAQLSKGRRGSLKQYDAAVNNTNTIIIGAWDGEKLAGIGVLNIVQTLGGCAGDIDDVVVGEEYRGQGVGRIIMDAIITTAKNKGATKLRLTSAARRVEANGLYRSLGFKLRETNSYVYNVK